MKSLLPIVLLTLLAAACQPAEQPQGELPTLAVLPTLTETEGPTVTPPDTATPLPTDTPAPTSSFTPTLTATVTREPSRTPSPTPTLPATIEPTRAAVVMATEAALEAPRFATFTPGPGGPPEGRPEMLADVVITESQFQEALNARLGGVPAINRAVVDFVPGGIWVELTASGGQAFITGRVLVTVRLMGVMGAEISIGDIQVNAPEPPEAYVQVVTGDFFFLMIDTLDGILKERLGTDQRLADIVVTDTAIEVTLVVPQT